jgi:hypothetical protein
VAVRLEALVAEHLVATAVEPVDVVASTGDRRELLRAMYIAIVGQA